MARERTLPEIFSDFYDALSGSGSWNDFYDATANDVGSAFGSIPAVQGAEALYNMLPDSGATRFRKQAEQQASDYQMSQSPKAPDNYHPSTQAPQRDEMTLALQQLLAQSQGAAPQDTFVAHGDAPVMRGGGDQGMSMGAYSKSLRPISQQGFIQNHQDMGLDPQTLSLLAEVQDNPSSPILSALMELLQAHQEQNRAIGTRDILESKGNPTTAALLLKLLLSGKLE